MKQFGKGGYLLNYIWGFLVIAGIVVGVFTGNIAKVSEAALSSSKEAVALAITMLGIMALWTGIMQIARATGLIASLTRGIRPIIRLLFPDLPKDHVANEYIASNMIANILGLGWAATPMGACRIIMTKAKYPFD